MPSPESKVYVETDLAYAAGIIDGEGSITIHRTMVPGKRSLSPAWHARVGVDMTESHIPIWLQETFGGNVWARPSKTGGRERLIWIVTRLNARDFLELIRPYLRQKGRQADLLCAFYSEPGISFAMRGRKSVAPEEIALRDSYAMKMSRLNGRKRNFASA